MSSTIYFAFSTTKCMSLFYLITGALTPPILYCYGYCSCSGSVLGILDPCRLSWFLRFVDGENDVVRLYLLIGGSLLFGGVGLDWQRCTMTESLGVLLLVAQQQCVARGAIWMAATRVSVVGLGSFWGLCISFYYFRD